jgi:hypothetical protein
VRRAALLGAAALAATAVVVVASTVVPSAVGRAEPLPATAQNANAPYDGLYHFLRIQYGASRSGGFGGFGRRGGREPMWAHDYPRAERNFLQIVKEMTFVGTQTEGSNVLVLDDPELFKFPIAYIVEVGAWNPTEEEAERLGEYLLKGGFLIVDDFRGFRDLDNLEYQLDRALPGHAMIMIDETNDVFDSFFRILPENVIPPYGGEVPIWYGVFEDNDPTKRMMIVINHNNDIAEYWEYSDYGYYPIDLANEAYKLGVNYVVYGLTH